jgi:NADH:ubiquinone oxidoreductase subunit 2 (subunit N)
MTLPLLIVVLLVYAVALVAAFRRWRWLGPVSIGLIAVVASMAWGTFEWHRPHTDSIQLSRFQDWRCHTISVVPSLVLLTLAGLAALRIVRTEPKWYGQLAAVVLGFGVAFWPAALLLLYTGVGLLACDTL